MFSKDELDIMMEWFEYLTNTIDVPIPQEHVDLAEKIDHQRKD